MIDTATQTERNATKILDAIRDTRRHHGHTDHVRLAEVREMAGLTRPDFDEAVRHLIRTGRAAVDPHPVPLALGPGDHAAAIRSGGETCHLIAIS